jgi:hypothetical protein
MRELAKAASEAPSDSSCTPILASRVFDAAPTGLRMSSQQSLEWMVLRTILQRFLRRPVAVRGPESLMSAQGEPGAACPPSPGVLVTYHQALGDADAQAAPPAEGWVEASDGVRVALAVAFSGSACDLPWRDRLADALDQPLSLEGSAPEGGPLQPIRWRVDVAGHLDRSLPAGTAGESPGHVEDDPGPLGRLRVWAPGENGRDRLVAITDGRDGVVYLGHVATPLPTMRDDRVVPGQLRSATLFLYPTDRPTDEPDQLDVAV